MTTTQINHRTLGQKGAYLRPIEKPKPRSKRRPGTPAWFKVGGEIDFYDGNGNKRFGIIRRIDQDSFLVQDSTSRVNHKLTLVDEAQAIQLCS